MLEDHFLAKSRLHETGSKLSGPVTLGHDKWACLQRYLYSPERYENHLFTMYRSFTTLHFRVASILNLLIHKLVLPEEGTTGMTECKSIPNFAASIDRTFSDIESNIGLPVTRSSVCTQKSTARIMMACCRLRLTPQTGQSKYRKKKLLF